jgi:hypothetical protein
MSNHSHFAYQALIVRLLAILENDPPVFVAAYSVKTTAPHTLDSFIKKPLCRNCVEDLKKTNTGTFEKYCPSSRHNTCTSCDAYIDTIICAYWTYDQFNFLTPTHPAKTTSEDIKNAYDSLCLAHHYKDISPNTYAAATSLANQYLARYQKKSLL